MLTVTFASVDWIMSLDPHWYSTIFGLLTVVGQGLSALAFTIAVLALHRAARARSAACCAPGHFHDLGKLLLAFVMLWAYLSFSQFLIIWSGNLPEEIPWYIARIRGGWGVVALLLVVGHFVLPFALLLSRDLKRHERPARAGRDRRPGDAAGRSDLAGRADLRRARRRRRGARRDFASRFTGWTSRIPVGLAGLWVFLFVRQLRSRPLLPRQRSVLQGGVRA